MTGGHSFLGLFDRGVIKMGDHSFLRHRNFYESNLTEARFELFILYRSIRIMMVFTVFLHTSMHLESM